MLSSFFFGKDDFTPAVPLPDYIFLEKNSNFTKRELKSLFNRFNSICHPETRLLERRAFLQQPEVAFSPLIPLAYDMELKEFVSEIASESTPNGLTFDRYVKILSVFSQKASINAKLSCIYQFLFF